MPETRTLSVFESLGTLKKFGIPTAPFFLATNTVQLEEALETIRYPCVLKAVSEKAVHKTEQNAVRLNINSKGQAFENFEQLKQIPAFEGVLVQPQVTGTELLVGSKKDIQFGSTIVFGLGGILVELLKDVSIRVAPVSRSDCLQMIREIRHQKVLQGFRGKPAVDEKKLVSVLLQTSKMLEKLSPQELDINPLMATKDNILAVDARIVL